MTISEKIEEAANLQEDMDGNALYDDEKQIFVNGAEWLLKELQFKPLDIREGDVTILIDGFFHSGELMTGDEGELYLNDSQWPIYLKPTNENFYILTDRLKQLIPITF